MKKELYPLKLSPICKEAIWGGTRLKEEFGKETPLEILAETWELTVSDKGSNIIENGIYKGLSLSEFLEGTPLLLLVKFIDARDDLSIQVHPSEEYALENEGCHGKTEMWYIVDANEDSSIVFGLKDYDRNSFMLAAKNAELNAYLCYEKVKKGDVFFIPAGCVHAIGKGILIAEIQQPSDITYRVYDYGRRDKNGNQRELHLEKALDVIRNFTSDEIEAIRYSGGNDGSLASCEYFRAEKLSVNGSITLASKEHFTHLLCIEGEGDIGGFPVRKGDSYLLPMGLSDTAISGELVLIASTPK